MKKIYSKKNESEDAGDQPNIFSYMIYTLSFWKKEVFSKISFKCE